MLARTRHPCTRPKQLLCRVNMYSPPPPTHTHTRTHHPGAHPLAPTPPPPPTPKLRASAPQRAFHGAGLVALLFSQPRAQPCRGCRARCTALNKQATQVPSWQYIPCVCSTSACALCVHAQTPSTHGTAHEHHPPKSESSARKPRSSECVASRMLAADMSQCTSRRLGWCRYSNPRAMSSAVSTMWPCRRQGGAGRSGCQQVSSCQ